MRVWYRQNSGGLLLGLKLQPNHPEPMLSCFDVTDLLIKLRRSLRHQTLINTVMRRVNLDDPTPTSLLAQFGGTINVMIKVHIHGLPMVLLPMWVFTPA